MMTALRVLKWLTGGGLDRLTQLISEIWAFFQEVSDVLGVRRNPDENTARNKASAVIAELKPDDRKEA